MKDKEDRLSNTSGEHFGVWNNPELETRLVAMLMGELSAFEEAEMEEELEKSPELRLFRDRMIEVQGLITEVNQQDKHSEFKEDWSLSSERRTTLLENFIEGKQSDLKKKEEPITTSTIQWKNIFSIAACLLISLAAFMVMFVRKGVNHKNEKNIASYHPAVDALLGVESKSARAEEMNFRTVNPQGVVEGERKRKSNFAIPMEERESLQRTDESFLANRLTSEDEMEGRVKQVRDSKRRENSPSDSQHFYAERGVEEKIVKPEMSNEAAKKPSAPSSRMSKVIAANTPNPKAVPVPKIDVNEPGLDFAFEGNAGFGDGDAFGDGYGDRGGRGGRGEVKKKSGNEKLAVIDGLEVEGKDSGLDPFGDAMDDEDLQGASSTLSRSAGSLADVTKGGSRKDLNLLLEDQESSFKRQGEADASLIGEGYIASGKKATKHTGVYDSWSSDGDKGKKADTGKLAWWLNSDIHHGTNSPNDDLSGEQIAGDRIAQLSDNRYRPGSSRNERGLNDKKNLKSLEDDYKWKESAARESAQEELAKKGVEYLDDPIRTNPTLTYKHVENIEKVRKQLYSANSYYDQAKFDDAMEEYKKTLRIDPYNKAARRGMEKVNAAKSDYYRAAYDQTRAKMLAEVDKTWEMAVPPAKGTKDKEKLDIAKMKAVSLELSGAKQKASEELAEAQRKVKQLKLMINNHATKEFSSELFGGDVGKIDAKSLKEAEESLSLAEKKFGFVEDFESRILKSDQKSLSIDALKRIESSAELIPERKIELAREKTTPDFTKEISAAQQTHSTFSLNVSDVSYKLAKSLLLEKGMMPEADKIRVEEFVNAFDYGDPSASGKKVSCVVEQCAHPFFQQRNLMRIGMKTGAMGRSQPLRLTVLLDNSGSMERADRAATVVKAVEALASQLGPQDEVTLLSFARGARLVAQKVKGDQAHQLVNLVRAIPSEGGTNLSLAIEQAYETAQQSVQEGAMSRIVIITDGAANLGNADPEDLSKSIEKMRQNGIAFDACGVGADGLDDDMLEALTRKGDGRYYFINRPEDADSGFAQKLAGALRPAAKNVKVQVVFNPERVGNYRLVGFEKHRLKKEDFRNDAVDAAEMAAEEAGNALYQVEAKPDGVGDVGTVFVRFRDMATGQMVERSWAIPYQPSIPGLSSAEPSMQLASVAGMLGERLKLGEEAGIDLKQMKPIFGKLRSHYYADKEVQDLIRMCEKVTQ